MNDRISLVVASVLGLVAGMGHGVVSHYRELPFSLSDQVVESFGSNAFDQSRLEL